MYEGSEVCTGKIMSILCLSKVHPQGQNSGGVFSAHIEGSYTDYVSRFLQQAEEGKDKNGLAGSKAVPGTSQWVPDQYFQEATWWRVKGISNEAVGQLRLSAIGSIIAQNVLADVFKRGESGVP
ncbi:MULTISPECIES: hypothetical protein [unclassified Pseudomonas]|uniref:hypothetical protein n=1 Tax=unclassified Pseudomonas TaxID=196821 RepID=UPI0025E48D08|nr:MULTISPECIES: hypothetical protein [unclassified Pseudomonas]